MEDTVNKDGTINVPVGKETKKATSEEVQAAVKAYLESGKPLEITHTHKAHTQSFGDHMAEIGWETAGTVAIAAAAFLTIYGLTKLVGDGQTDAPAGE